jgi:hypothetical protein
LPENDPNILEIKILVAGIELSGQSKTIDYYGAVEGNLTNDEFIVKEISVETELSILTIEFWEPIDKNLENFRKLYEKDGVKFKPNSAVFVVFIDFKSTSPVA